MTTDVKLTPERCPVCGAHMPENNRGDRWCSLLGCRYIVPLPEAEMPTVSRSILVCAFTILGLIGAFILAFAWLLL